VTAAPPPAARPLAAPEFAELMAALGPWPARPSLAVAVSGGRDSLALALLLADWTRGRRGRLLALTVDHGLRPGSAGEARRVGRWLGRRGIEHRLLRWRDPPAGQGPIQAAARTARYALLAAACRRAGLLHLCLAHQADDQAETLLLRLAAGSGPLGLAGMSALRATPDLLILRPLLPVPRDRPAATLEAAGQAWLDDPSNQDPRHRRVALRRARPALAAAGLTAPRLDAMAATLGRLRSLLEDEAAALLAAAVAWHPAGFARLAPAPFAAAIAPVARLALGELLRALGGRPHAAATAALERALAALAAGRRRGFTLAGVRLLRQQDAWLAVRESGAAPLAPGDRRWAGAWDVRWPAAAPADWRLRELGQAGWQALAAELAPAALPGPARWPLPTLADGQGLLALPALGWHRPGGRVAGFDLRFRPQPPAGSFGFTVACGQRHII